MLSKRWLWPLLALFFLALAARFLPGPRTIDDAYITFRYARNLLSGEGLVFNPGERVLGTTTPLYTFLLAGLGLFAGGASAPFPWLALGVNAIADGFSAILLVLIGRQLGSRLAGWGAALAWAIAPFSVTFAIGGMETSVYIFLLLSTFWAYCDKRYSLAAFSAMLSLLTRPDALILILPLAIDRVILNPMRGGQRLSMKEVSLFLVPLSLWLVFAWSYFGNPLPQSLSAKNEAYLLAPLSAFIRLLQHYATPFMGQLSFGLPWIRIGLVLFPFLALVGTQAALRKNAASLPFAIFPWFYFAAFAIANPLIFRWYLSPPLPFYFLFILLGIERLLQDFFTWLTEQRPIPVWLTGAATGFFVLLAPGILLLADWEASPSHGPQRPAPEIAWLELELLYQQAAVELKAEIVGNQGAATLAAGDVGALGYFSNAHILDLVGLNSPQTLNYYPLAEEAYTEFIYAVPTQLVLDEQPDFIVILEIYGRETLLQSAVFQKIYLLKRELTTNIYGSEGMLIFERK